MSKKLEKDTDNKNITEFTCSNCNEKGECQKGRYVCA